MSILSASRSTRPFIVSPSDGLNARASASSIASSVSRNGATSWVKPRPGPCVTCTRPYSVIACSSLPSAGASRMRKSSMSAEPTKGRCGCASWYCACTDSFPPCMLRIVQATQQLAGVVHAGGETAPAAIGNDFAMNNARGPVQTLDAQLPHHAAVMLGVRHHVARRVPLRHQHAIELRVQLPGRPGGGRLCRALPGAAECDGRDAAPDRASHR